MRAGETVGSLKISNVTGSSKLGLYSPNLFNQWIGVLEGPSNDARLTVCQISTEENNGRSYMLTIIFICRRLDLRSFARTPCRNVI